MLVVAVSPSDRRSVKNFQRDVRRAMQEPVRTNRITRELEGFHQASGTNAHAATPGATGLRPLAR